MKTFIAIFLLSAAFIANAQDVLPKKHIQLIVGRSFHGSGDLSGFSITTEYAQYFKKRICWTMGLGGTFHDGTIPLFYSNDISGDLVDASLRYTTAGVQISGNLGYSIVKSSKHEFMIRLGALLRYQSSSYYDEVSIYYPATTDLPFPVYGFVNTTPQRTKALGGNAQMSYNYRINNIMTIGALGGFQTDTNGDTITQLSFTVGGRF